MTRRKCSFGAAILFLAVALTPVAAGAAPYEEGLVAYTSGDYATALRLWRPLAEQGEAHAQHNLGVMYRDGQGVPLDHAKAVYWYTRAAEQGHADAQTSLGIMYYDGLGVSRNYAEAAKWFQLAAEQGHALAQNNLGVMYALGNGVLRDFLQIHMWFGLAVSRFPPGEDRDKAVKAQNTVAAQMTSAQIAEAQRLAREWKPRGKQAE